MVPAPLLAQLLQCSHPVFDVIAKRKLSIFHREYIEGHGLKALAGGLSTPELARGRAGGFATHDDLVAIHLEVFNFPAQVWNTHPHALKNVRQLFPREKLKTSKRSEEHTSELQSLTNLV